MILFLIRIVQWVCDLYSFILFARVLLSWVNPDPYNIIVQWIHRLTEPVLAPIRRLFRVQWSMIDFSPIIAFIAIELIKSLLTSLLLKLL